MLDGWVWLSARDSRSCLARGLLHGTKHRLDERLDDHVCGRCTDAPLTNSWEDILGEKAEGIPEKQLQTESGADWFIRQPEVVQRKMMGPAKYSAWKAGAFDLKDLVGRGRSARWGTMRYERSLTDRLGAKEAAKWKKKALEESAMPRSLGAAASWQAKNQTRRMAQLGVMTQAELQALVARMASTAHLPRLSYHFQKHGVEFGAQTEQEYEQLFTQHIRRDDLQRFTFLSRVGARKMWYLTDMTSGTIAVYDETKQQPWSFFRHPDITRLLAEMRPMLVELLREDDKWVARL